MQRPTPPLLPPIATSPWKSPTSPPPTASSTQSNTAQTIFLLLQHKVFDFFAYVREHLLFAVKQKKRHLSFKISMPVWCKIIKSQTKRPVYHSLTQIISAIHHLLLCILVVSCVCILIVTNIFLLMCKKWPEWYLHVLWYLNISPVESAVDELAPPPAVPVLNVWWHQQSGGYCTVDCFYIEVH